MHFSLLLFDLVVQSIAFRDFSLTWSVMYQMGCEMRPMWWFGLMVTLLVSSTWLINVETG